MTNLETIQFLYSNYKKFFKNTPNRAITEDCLQQVAQNLMKVDCEIEEPEKFIRTCLFNELKSYHSKNKRYELVDLPQDTAADCIISQIHEEEDIVTRIKNMHTNITRLPNGQKAAIAYFLENGKFSSDSGPMESLRTNYKLGIKNLRKLLLK